MHRLLKIQHGQVQKIRTLSTFTYNSKSDFIIGDRACSLCKQLQNCANITTRNQSTKTSPNVRSKRVRRKRTKNTKFAELLEVTDNSTIQKKASVQKLSSNHLSMLANTNYSLNELYKLKPFSSNIYVEHTYNNLTIIDNIANPADIVINDIKSLNEKSDQIISITDKVNVVFDENCQELVNDESEIAVPESELFESLDVPIVPSTFQPEALEEHSENLEEEEENAPLVIEKGVSATAPTKNEKTVDLVTKHEILSKTLAAYIETCISLKLPQRGLSAFNSYKYKAKRLNHILPEIQNISVYNALLKGFAQRGDLNKLQEVLKLSAEASVDLNLQSYAAIFECLSRSETKDDKLVEKYIKEALGKGFTFDRILNEATFLNDQRSRVLNTIRRFDSNYKPQYQKPCLQYQNHLLDTLNSDEQLKVPAVKNEKNASGLFTESNLRSLVHKQLNTEKCGYVTVQSIEATMEATEETLKYRKLLDEHIKMWETAALKAYNRDLSALIAKKGFMNLDVYMRCIPPKDFVSIIVEEAKKIAQGSETYSPTVSLLYKELGLKVYTRYRLLRKQKTGVLDKILKIHNKYCDTYAATHKKLDVLPDEEIDCLNPRQKWQWVEYLCKGDGSTISMDHQEWVQTVWQNVGKFLYHIVMHDLKIDVNAMRLNSKHKNYLPAFYTVFRNQGRAVKEEVKPHPVLSRLHRASMPETLTFPTNDVPMRCPPVPWVSIQTGGYLILPTDVIRLPFSAAAQKQRLIETSPADLYPSLDALNQLAAVPWKVNNQILDVILEVFKSGGSAKLDVPEPPSALPQPPPPTPDMDKTQKYLAFRQKLQHRRKKAEMYSLWCDCLYRLSLANHFRNDIFWLPHNMDFRGRVYPVPPHLNHLGSDLARSMLIFAESRPLGPNGLDWLKLHLVNLTGLKKRDSVNDRLIFANSMLEEIFDSADNPLTGRMWWSQSDEPWQTLACCMEIAAAARSEKPEEYESHFPVHQDGSCNGLQHYAALGRDSSGAYSVNLTPSHYPQDVYSAVVNLVEEQRKKDAQEGLKVAKVLDGYVKRKVIKQTVMTTVYGVTRFGARLQIARQLKDIDDFPKDSVWAASSYLTGRTFDSIRTMFTSTREIQDWFTECARLISSVGCQNVEWITPLGLPIVQPYSRQKKFSVNKLDHNKFNIHERPNVMKQKNAFPPNFIHSLDSSHMMLTSLYCERSGITFVSVHDCYWTHPSTVHIMNKVCREQFVALHSEPILENLSVFLAQRFSYKDNEFTDDGSVVDLTKRKLNRVLRQLPKTGKFDIRQVLNSVYFFS